VSDKIFKFLKNSWKVSHWSFYTCWVCQLLRNCYCNILYEFSQ